MAVNPVEVRLAKLEGSYEQIDRRLGSIEDRLGRLETKLDTLAVELRREIDTVAVGLRGEMGHLRGELRGEMSGLRHDIGAVNGRVHTILYGVISAVLVPILIRIFFP